MTPKRTSTSAAPTMTQAAIRQLVADSVAAALEAQVANMENGDNTNRNPEPRERTESMFSRTNCTEDCKVKFATGLPQSIEGNVTASKPQTLEEAINISQRLMDHVLKYNPAQETNDHKQKFNDRRNTTTNNNYPNDHDNKNHYHNPNNNNYQNNCDNNYNNRNNDHHQQQNSRQEAVRAYAVNQTKNS
nr:hypothetical protein [Tanacetum cinerariifolium]GFA88511.1 hypothetical protein [Tanacetum cinerariifolium]